METDTMLRSALGGLLLLGVLGLAAPAGRADSDLLAKAETAVARAEQPSAPWSGPTTGPRARTGKYLVYIAEDLRNGGVLGVGRGIREAAKAIGWRLDIVDLQGSDDGRQKGFEKAVALRPDGVILGGMDAVANVERLKVFERMHIPLVGWHVAPAPGPVAGTPVALNVTTDNLDVARIAAYYAIAKSRGEAKVVIFTDSNFDIATFKSNAMADIIRACGGCKLLSIEDIPISRAEQLLPERTESLQQRFNQDWQYSLAINDIYFDFATPWLTAADTATENAVNISAGDGSPSAFQRIRSGSLQSATVPEPLNLQGWQLVDEMNRLLSKAPVSGYSTPVHLVTDGNIGADGGERGSYDPDNGYRDIYRKIWGVDN